MIRAFLLALTLAFAATTAWAGSNIVQKGTGATVWEDQDGIQVPVGEAGLTVLLENVSTASSAYVVSHKAGNIVKIYSVLFGTIASADATVDFGTFDTSGVQTAISGGSGGTITLTASGSNAGDIDSVTYTPGTDPDIEVQQGEVIYVHTDGGSTNDIDAVITIVIE